MSIYVYHIFIIHWSLLYGYLDLFIFPAIVNMAAINIDVEELLGKDLVFLGYISNIGIVE